MLYPDDRNGNIAKTFVVVAKSLNSFVDVYVWVHTHTHAYIHIYK